jgi:hypothetical protein
MTFPCIVGFIGGCAAGRRIGSQVRLLGAGTPGCSQRARRPARPS